MSIQYRSTDPPLDVPQHPLPGEPDLAHGVVLPHFGQRVSVVTKRRVVDQYEDVTETVVERPGVMALFEPQQQQPRTDVRSPGISSPARWYLPAGDPVTEDDVVRDRAGREWIVTSVQPWPHLTVADVKRWGTS